MMKLKPRNGIPTLTFSLIIEFRGETLIKNWEKFSIVLIIEFRGETLIKNWEKFSIV